MVRDTQLIPWSARRGRSSSPVVSYTESDQPKITHGRQRTVALESLDRALQFREIPVTLFQIPARQPPVIRGQIQVVCIIVDHGQVLNDLRPMINLVESMTKQTDWQHAPTTTNTPE